MLFLTHLKQGFAYGQLGDRNSDQENLFFALVALTMHIGRLVGKTKAVTQLYFAASNGQEDFQNRHLFGVSIAKRVKQNQEQNTKVNQLCNHCL